MMIFELKPRDTVTLAVNQCSEKLHFHQHTNSDKEARVTSTEGRGGACKQMSLNVVKQSRDNGSRRYRVRSMD